MIATNIEQSKKLREIVPIDTADMYWLYTDGEHHLYVGRCSDENGEPAWSLSALLGLLKLPDLDRISKDEWMCGGYLEDMSYEADYGKDPIEACVKIIKTIYG